MVSRKYALSVLKSEYAVAREALAIGGVVGLAEWVYSNAGVVGKVVEVVAFYTVLIGIVFHTVGNGSSYHSCHFTSACLSH